MEVMQPCRNPAVIPEVEGVQAFPPAFFYMAGEGRTARTLVFNSLYYTSIRLLYVTLYMSHFSLL